MSRIGKRYISIPNKVNVWHSPVNKQRIYVDGPWGRQTHILPSCILCYGSVEYPNISNRKIFLEQAIENKLAKSQYGLSRTIISNMVTGVSKRWHKKLNLTGVGYRAQHLEDYLVLHVGYSHVLKISTMHLSITFESPTSFTVSGINKQVVNEFAARVRSVRPPEPYKGKGIAYENEIILRKAGKTGKTGKK